MTVVYHGLSRFAWEVVQRQGALRCARGEVRAGLICRVVGNGGELFVTTDAYMAAIFAATRIDRRTLDRTTVAAIGRQEIPEGIAQQDGVVLATEADDLSSTERTERDGEYVCTQDIPAERLHLLAYIREGYPVADELERGDVELPPLSSAHEALLRQIDPDQVLVMPSARVADLPSQQGTRHATRHAIDAWSRHDRWKGTRRHPVRLHEFWLVEPQPVPA
jgi:hypothetical protein